MQLHGTLFLPMAVGWPHAKCVRKDMQHARGHKIWQQNIGWTYGTEFIDVLSLRLISPHDK